MGVRYHCKHVSSQVLDSRIKNHDGLGRHRHRRRECDLCGVRYSTKEVRLQNLEIILRKANLYDQIKQVGGLDND